MKRSFIYLVVLTAFALLALWLFAPSNKPSGNITAGTLLLPDISEQINEVDRVEIITAGDNTIATLIKLEDSWRFEQMYGYRADWPKLRSLLASLAQAQVIETKTDKPEYYARLGVEDVSSADASSVLVRLGDTDHMTGILIGSRAQGRPGSYVRLEGVAASALVDQELDVSTDPLNWVDSTIIDINASEVAEVEIIHTSGERLLVTRISADHTDFDLVDMPMDREIKSSWAVNSLGSVFSMLNMETVRPAGDIDWSGAVKMRMLMFSGIEIMADMLNSGDSYLLRLSASHPAADIVGSVLDAKEASTDQLEIDKQAMVDIAKMVNEINQNTSEWIYGITKQKYDALVQKPEDLLKPLESS